MCCHGTSKSIHKWCLIKMWSCQDSTRNRYTISTSTDFGKSALYHLHGLLISIAHCHVVSLTNVSAVSKQQDARWGSFRWSIPLFIDYVSESSIDRVISIPSCLYCIWNRYSQNHSRVPPNILLFVWYCQDGFNRMPCPNGKMYDEVVSLIDSVIHWISLE